jgi:16S rRNA (guanine966-N2)-methyltransferase
MGSGPLRREGRVANILRYDSAAMTAAARRMATPPKTGRIRAGANRLRIIGGAWRSRVLRFPDAEGLRPTPDRVRETLFNWLGQHLAGLACVDLFAGSGALGFEARSRGAAQVTLVERDRKVAAQLRLSAAVLGDEGIDVVNEDAMAWLRREPGPFDVAFIDPPYDSGLAGPAMRALEPCLRRGARVYVEASDLPEAPSPRWVRLRRGGAGAVRFALFEFDGPATLAASEGP